MLAQTSPYRDGRDCVRARLADVRKRLADVDERLAHRTEPLPRSMQARLTRLRTSAEPASASADDVLRAERCLGDLESQLDEMVSLAADLHRSMKPIWPSRLEVWRWSVRCLLSCAILVTLGSHLGAGDFMLQAFGVKLQRARATMPCERFSFEAYRAALGEHPEHAQWVDPPR